MENHDLTFETNLELVILHELLIELLLEGKDENLEILRNKIKDISIKGIGLS